MKILDDKQIESLKSFLEYQYKSHVSCSDIANRLDITYDKAKELIKILLRNNVLEMNFKIFCENELDTNIQDTYENIEDIPEEPCSNCEKKCSILKNVIVIYKVISRDIYE
ncbi:hypothetical protein DP149_06055 [Clostridium tetani]|uniref:hypothetical protein n=1 Tax=Clostridium tetani TaxID=1513 RepID=UPI0002F83B05|nr:hypothetical protein [Clostridium tetani]KGI38415.1 hypothetical protein KY52_07980 [Clostridium tetani]KGI40288.1 hypothetical protein LA33_06395 [Clostridium tetani ATCC 9441]KGI42863.1 hypothetical protein KY54_12605 [Clostridium tetani]KHO33613.1 hypothetical protein OR63_05415 [Clostridium tetani]KIG21582.1 hypothetical protein RS78_03615 [Clostridium tetani]